jgi:S-methylmethionine-dependent homocysteine/selenocysteine methylase
VIIDGATGTLLGARGFDTGGTLFGGAALLDDEGLRCLRGVHRDYAQAGAEMVTANTFRTNPRKAKGRWRELTSRAVQAAREAGVLVAGSMAPVEDCYLPELRPAMEVARAEHREMADALLVEGCDLLLVETICAFDEGLVAVEAAAATGLPVWAAAMAMPDGRMRDGGDLRAFFREARARGASAALVNCVPCDGVDAGLAAALESGLPCGGYAHMGEVDAESGWPPAPLLTPAGYAVRASRWLARGASIVGGCCGTTPAHIQALTAISPRPEGPLVSKRRL